MDRLSKYNVEDLFWYTGQDKRLLSSGRICHLLGNGTREQNWARPFRRGNLLYVIMNTPQGRRLALWHGGHTGASGWVHKRWLKPMSGECLNCGGLKLANDYICIKCRSAGIL